jgi:hypothetical protein
MRRAFAWCAEPPYDPYVRWCDRDRLAMSVLRKGRLTLFFQREAAT